MAEISTCILILVVVLTVIFLFGKAFKKGATGKLVPGPSITEGLRTFITGMRDNSLHLWMSSMAQKYGYIMQINLLLRKVIFVNDANTFRRIVKDATLRDVTNDRPPTFFAEYYYKGGKNIAFTKFGPELHKKRKIFHMILKFYGEGRGQFEQLMLTTLGEVEQRLKTAQTDDLQATIKNYILGLIGFLLTGDISNSAKRNLSAIKKFSDALNEIFLFENETLLQPFPFLRFIPGLRFKRLTTEVSTALKNLENAYFYEMKETFNPACKRGFVDDLLEMQLKGKKDDTDIELDDDTVKGIIVDVVAAAFLTTTSTLSSLFLQLVKHQVIQASVYEEIKRVIGNSTPSFQHKQHMPYTDAVIMETLRLSSSLPMLAPHFIKEDITFDGYFIPKSTILMMNAWYSQHREDVWEDPFAFKPERFLDVNGQLLESGNPIYEHLIPFGTGRRSCPGESFGKSRIFLVTVYLLQKFQFLPSGGESSLPPTDPREWQTFGVLSPKKFISEIKVRETSV